MVVCSVILVSSAHKLRRVVILKYMYMQYTHNNVGFDKDL